MHTARVVGGIDDANNQHGVGPVRRLRAGDMGLLS